MASTMRLVIKDEEAEFLEASIQRQKQHIGCYTSCTRILCCMEHHYSASSGILSPAQDYK